MRRPLLLPAIVLVAVAACADEPSNPVQTEAFTVQAFARPVDASATNFRAHARGEEEVPSVDTDAQGQATFKLSPDGQELGYRLVVANIDDVLMSHIHREQAGSNGPIVVWLYPSAPPAQLIPGTTNGVLAEGVITAADLMGPLSGMELDDLVEELRGGNAYVNVHTSAHPPGEIRGQVR